MFLLGSTIDWKEEKFKKGLHLKTLMKQHVVVVESLLQLAKFFLII